MLSKDTDQLRDILALAGKDIPQKRWDRLIKKMAQGDLDAAEKWAVTRNAATQQESLPKKVPAVPKMPEWLFKL